MASVQPNPDMGGQRQMPGNLTREQVGQVLKRYQEMRQQGVPDTNPELIKARNLLAMVQKQNQYQQHQRAASQQQMLLQRQQGLPDQITQQNGTAVGLSNGAKPAGVADGKVPTGSLASSMPSSGMQVSTAGGQAPSADGQTPTSATSGPTALSKEQLLMLRTQIGAFKHLSKGLPLPANMQQQIFGHHQSKKTQDVAEAVTAASQVLDNATRASSASGGAVQDTRTLPRLPDTFIEPWSSEAFRDVNYISHTQRRNRLLILLS